MNERIKEIARQAGLNAPYGSDHEGLRDFDYRKFAELIVRDAIKEILEWKNEPFPFDENTAVWILKKHFGIKE